MPTQSCTGVVILERNAGFSAYPRAQRSTGLAAHSGAERFTKLALVAANSATWLYVTAMLGLAA